jgi:hypothetical protein
MSIFKFTTCTPVLSAVCISLIFFLGSSSGETRKMRRIASGTWGGDHIRLEVTGDKATIEYDCANGTIAGPLLVDAKGNFKLSGTHVREHGGPVRRGESGDSRPASYSGWTNGTKMTLTVVLRDTKEAVGTFTLIRGQAGRVWKCK